MAGLSPPPTAWATAELQEALGGQYYILPWRGPLASMGRSLVRSDGTWLGGVIIFLILAGILPLTFVAMSIFCMLAVATCLRAFALHEYARQLTELAMQENGDLDAPEDAAEGTGTAGAPGSSSPQRRRARATRPALLRAVAAAGRPLSLLNLRLSLVDRDFTDQDYQLLLRLDELEAGASSQPEPPPPLPEDQLAQLPVHVHRTPTKKGRKPGGTGFTPSSTPRKGLFTSSKGTSGTAGAREPAAPPGCVPVLVEQAAGGVHAAQQLQLGSAPLSRASAWAGSAKVGAAAAATAAADSAGSGGIKAARPAGAAAASERGQEIVPSAVPVEHEGSEVEDEEEPLCSVCLEPFADGAKILSLPCKHQFHADCATQWLRYKGFHATCPNCKGQVFTPPANTPRA
ncbi:E3 ubiquitin- ligase SDIR1 isoform X1 [Chlorella sorokiniana]|uniref:RING-type E3 ubiquitin transferase n=1 Tax=Chlorella sorokiniana TaxID=3076 RepID=A0A2P6TLX1_CHLSO|nr:E3 ubiquitin- ligase SDIR1 isoform X1 [Chlorella sorokiniana]|eukprot:PRW45336.1 E3 ubiquitin- ligase SDIR1 isoform X1 [Chlorella sorokiniana]